MAENNTTETSTTTTTMNKTSGRGGGGGKKKRDKGQTMELSELFSKHSSTAGNWGEVVASEVDQMVLTPTGHTTEEEVMPQDPRPPESCFDLSEVPESGPYRLHITNLNFHATEEDVFRHFNSDNRILDIKFAYENDRFKGTAYMVVDSREALIDAMKRGGTASAPLFSSHFFQVMQQRNIKVAVAHPRGPPRSSDRQSSGRNEQQGRSRQNNANVYDNGMPPSSQAQAQYRRHDQYNQSNQSSGHRGNASADYEHPRQNYNGPYSGRGGTQVHGYRGHQRYDNQPPSMNYGYYSSQQQQQPQHNPAYNDSYQVAQDGGYSYGHPQQPQTVVYTQQPAVYPQGYVHGYAQPHYHQHDNSYGGGYDQNQQGQAYARGSGGGQRRMASNQQFQQAQQMPPVSPPDETPVERKPLVLKPRTVPLSSTDEEAETRKSSIFGQAKPVDTRAREKQIEHKMQLERANSVTVRKISENTSGNSESFRPIIKQRPSTTEEQPPTTVIARQMSAPPLSEHRPPPPPPVPIDRPSSPNADTTGNTKPPVRGKNMRTFRNTNSMGRGGGGVGAGRGVRGGHHNRPYPQHDRGMARGVEGRPPAASAEPIAQRDSAPAGNVESRRGTRASADSVGRGASRQPAGSSAKKLQHKKRNSLDAGGGDKSASVAVKKEVEAKKSTEKEKEPKKSPKNTVKEMPKFVDDKPVNFSDNNKFALLEAMNE